MANGKADIWIWAALTTAVTALYGFFIRHVIGHVAQAEIEKLQSKDVCNQIVKRMDDNHREVCERLDKIFEKLDKE